MKLLKTNQLGATIGRPVGYVRTKIFNRNILNKTLIDGGNLFGDLMSEEFAKLLKLQISGREKTVGTAAADGTVTILGKVTKPFKLYLEGISTPVTIQPYVVKNLAHPINLGERFLRENDADQSYRRKGVQLRINGGSIMLDSSDLDLSKSSIDTRIKSVLDKFQSEGRNPWSGNTEILDMRIHQVTEKQESTEIPGVFYKGNKKEIEWGNTAARVYNPQTQTLRAKHTTVVEVRIGKGDTRSNHPTPRPGMVLNNDVLLFPKKTQSWLNKHEVFVHPGVYYRNGNTCNIYVTNFSTKDCKLPKDCHLGNVKEAVRHMAPRVTSLDHRPVKQLSASELNERRQYIIEQLELKDHKVLQGNPEALEEVIQIFLKGWSAISIDETDFGKTKAMRFQIQLEPGARPVRDKVRPLNPMQEKDLNRQIDEWLEAGVIEPSNSAWTSALVPCKKKGTEKYRWAIDYRKLNQLTVKDAYPLANIEANLHKLSGTVYFSTLDSAGAFHTIPVEEEHRDYTAFGTPFGQYRFCRLPFGLANAPSAYSRLVQMALNQLPPGFAMGYIDDIIIHSTSLQKHIEHLKQVVELHVRMGMKLNLRKCKIIRKEVEYLGHMVSKDSIRMVPSYVEKILDWPLPQTGKQLRSFLGFTGYYRSFIKEYAYLTAEMNKIKTQQTVDWTPEITEKFEQLKKCFRAEPLRGYPQYDSSEPFILDTDFSSTNMAAVLNQKQNGKEVFLGCVAKKCGEAESNYPPHKGELAAVILGLKKFEHILRAKPFVIRTDSKCVEYVNSMKEYRGIYARWNCFLSSFNYSLVHRAGKLNQNADPLSRREGLELAEENPEVTEYLHDIDDIYAIRNKSGVEEGSEDSSVKVAEISLAQLKSMTGKDPTFVQLLPYLDKGVKPDKEERKTLGPLGMSYVNIFECLSVEDGIIYYQIPEVNEQEGNKLLCLPVQLYNPAFDLCHSHPSSGHFGMTNTFSKMKDRFYFPNMYAFVSSKINNCVPCISKRKRHPVGQHAMHREELSYFGQRVYCDIVGPLTPSKHHGKMCSNLLTIQDGFTRYLVAIPIPDQQTKTLVEAIINHWIYVFGCMEVMHTDRGASYTANLFQEVMKQLGVVKTVTPPYSPEGDRVERAHRVLGDILRSDNRFEAQNWTAKLPAALLAYNSTVNRVIGISPFEAVFYRKVTLPVDLVFPFTQPEGVSWSSHIEDLKSKLSMMYERITNHQSTVLARENARIQARTGTKLQVGDMCYYFLARNQAGVTRKLQTNWIGPFVIKRVISESLVVIYPAGGWCKVPKEISVIVNRLRKVSLELPTVPDPGLSDLDLDEMASEQDIMAEHITYSFQGNTESSSEEGKENNMSKDTEEVLDVVDPPPIDSNPIGPLVLNDAPPDTEGVEVEGGINDYSPRTPSFIPYQPIQHQSPNGQKGSKRSSDSNTQRTMQPRKEKPRRSQFHNAMVKLMSYKKRDLY